ncbi:hypothetical protein ABGB19_22755 [Mycobacterium sp. B14F4]|uniref:hypothetical protein n=1 Tax=Mycobacterium sp. B14F4 TaxID=3153565 RepID=UPI00325F8CC5
MLRPALVATLIALCSAPVACAEPAEPAGPADPGPAQASDACTAERAGVMTWLPGATMPSVCQNFAWQPQTTPQPPADRWLSTGPPLKLHGQGQRNPNLAAGNWVGTPQDSSSVCRAQHQVVVSPGELSAAHTDEGQPGQPLAVELPPRTFTIELAGYCLWVRA